MSPSDPAELASFTDDGKSIQVIIETPKGSRNKFAFDEKRQIFRLKKVLPVGMAFPYDFGFVPSTKAEDGDPVDVLVLIAPLDSASKACRDVLVLTYRREESPSGKPRALGSSSNVRR